MIQRAKKRTMFLAGLLLASVFGFISAHVRSNYSKTDSLLVSSVVPSVYADAGGAWAGDSGGCSGSDSSADGGAADDGAADDGASDW